jgi:hypothetical protein
MSIYFIDLSELDRRARNGRITSLGVLREEAFVLVTRVFLWVRELPWVT